jgi:secondary thiamine-phosphate synthase enzyme
MSAITDYITLSTCRNKEIIDITPMMQDIVADKKVKAGIAVAFVPGSTGAITTIEYEPGLKQDVNLFLERLLPYDAQYQHHNIWQQVVFIECVHAFLCGYPACANSPEA